MIISYIVAPVIGGIIGYITNDLAIRMLFRPHEKKYIFGVHIPLTPGVIPKEKERIAGAIGKVISENLMSHEVLEKYLLSDAMTGKLSTSIEDFIAKQKNNPETVAEFIGHYLSEEEIQGMSDSVKESLTRQIHGKLSDQKLGDKVAHVAVKHVLDSLSDDNNSNEILNGLPSLGIIRSLGRGALEMVLAALQEPVENLLSRNINDILKNNGDEIVSNLIGDETSRLLGTPVQQLLQGREEQLAKVPNKIVNMYKKAISENLPRILETIDISKIVCDRINDMDVAEAEELILQVMKKELKAIVWLGAGLGFLMGFVNAII